MKRFPYPLGRAALSVLALLILATTPALADTIELADGRTLEGNVVSADDRVVIIEVRHMDASIRTTLPRASIRSIEKVVREGPTVVFLPIVGTIGFDETSEHYITGETFTRALAEIRRAKPDYVVLVIDSPGGSIEDMGMMIRAIEEANDLHFVAHVHNAHSAAAVIAMTCPRIYMSPDAGFGAAVPYQIGPDGTPLNIEEKWRSAIRAVFRNAANLGGHSPALMRGMSEMGAEIMLTHDENGKPLVVDSSPDTHGRVIKRKGEILTLTADEAIEYGLSGGTFEVTEDLCAALGHPAWTPVRTHIWDYIVEKPRQDRRQLAQLYQQARQQLAREQNQHDNSHQQQRYIQQVMPEVKAIEARLTELDKMHNEAKTAETETLAVRKQQIDELYKYHASRRSSAVRSRKSKWDIQRMDNEYAAQRKQLINTFDQRLDQIKSARDRMLREARDLRQRLDQLVTALP